MNARVVTFVAHRTRIRQREMENVARQVNRFGQYVRPTADEAKRLHAEQLEHQRRDSAWESRHGPVEGGCMVLHFGPREQGAWESGNCPTAAASALPRP